jgi:hypothetical protein
MSILNEDLFVSLVDEFLEPFGIDSDFSSDFSYDPEDERVYFSVMVSERADRLFKQYVLSHFHFEISNIFMISLLHEVGHAFTLNSFSKMEIKNDHLAKETIEEMLHADDSDDIYSLYFDLKIERVATAWAINYYKANKKRCDDFYLKFVSALKKEYLRLGLTE